VHQAEPGQAFKLVDVQLKAEMRVKKSGNMLCVSAFS
jgi:hypothetical protein